MFRSFACLCFPVLCYIIAVVLSMVVIVSLPIAGLAQPRICCRDVWLCRKDTRLFSWVFFSQRGVPCGEHLNLSCGLSVCAFGYLFVMNEVFNVV